MTSLSINLQKVESLKLNSSHCSEHKYRHGFRDTIDLMSKWSLETDVMLYFLLLCKLCSSSKVLYDTVASFVRNIPEEDIPLDILKTVSVVSIANMCLYILFLCTQDLSKTKS